MPCLCPVSVSITITEVQGKVVCPVRSTGPWRGGATGQAHGQVGSWPGPWLRR